MLLKRRECAHTVVGPQEEHLFVALLDEISKSSGYRLVRDELGAWQTLFASTLFTRLWCVAD